MTTQQFDMDVPMTMTPDAVKKVHQLVLGEGNHALMLRSFIVGGGCSGFQYSFTFTEQFKHGDQVMVFDMEGDHDITQLRLQHRYVFPDSAVEVYELGHTQKDVLDPQLIDEEKLSLLTQAGDAKQYRVSLCVDKLSIQYLRGATIDYVNDVQGQRFVIQNPNAKTTCGCGASFDTQ